MISSSLDIFLFFFCNGLLQLKFKFCFLSVPVDWDKMDLGGKGRGGDVLLYFQNQF